LFWNSSWGSAILRSFNRLDKEKCRLRPAFSGGANRPAVHLALNCAQREGIIMNGGLCMEVIIPV
jgi:hypothetical protein